MGTLQPVVIDFADGALASGHCEPVRPGWRDALDRLVKATLGNDPVELEEALREAQEILEDGE